MHKNQYRITWETDYPTGGTHVLLERKVANRRSWDLLHTIRTSWALSESEWADFCAVLVLHLTAEASGSGLGQEYLGYDLEPY